MLSEFNARASWSLLTLLAGCGGVQLAPPPSAYAPGAVPADLVVLHGKVITMDPGRPQAEAVAIRDGVFVQVGTDAEVRPLIGPATRVLEAAGRSVLPGLIDTHVHPLDVAAREAVEPFQPLESVAAIQGWVRRKVAAAPPGQWIKIPRAYPTRMRERRFPTRAELDAAAPGNPVVFDGSYAQVVNTAALEDLGITRDTPSPAGGEIVKNAAGEPTGLLRNMSGAFRGKIPSRKISDEETLGWLEKIHGRYLEVGITSIIERYGSVSSYRLYQRLKAEGRLRVRTVVTLSVGTDGTLEGTEAALRKLPLRFRDGDDWLRVGPIKISVDGGILIGTSYLREPYGLQAARLYSVEDPHYHGTLSLSADTIKNVIRAGHRQGWQMASHVTGDAGVDLVLDAVEAANADKPIKDWRYTLIHAYFPNPEAIKRAAALGVVVDTQPAWFYQDADAIADALGPERVSRFIGVADWLRGGVTVAINTDHIAGMDPLRAYNPFNPFLTMYTVVTRKTKQGRVIGADQRVPRETALAMMTTSAAYLSFDESTKGSIARGKLGDLVIVDRDFAACPPDSLKDIRVVATVVGGRVAYAADR